MKLRFAYADRAAPAWFAAEPAAATEHRVLALALASKRAIVQAPQIATSGGRAKGLRREVTGMDARQALRPHGWGLQRVLPGAGP
ncbi:protein of unknown function [Pseudomonas sp. JV551A1]|uniref:Uncharacterized protein n=1 Tax=Pseudomonas inefficax TaxID=2078786 RepID=A0AAQ1P3Q9_9PSED|nr:protein of unknown function [Pseudomonas sp. JV551A1]SPO59285.1 protein of unknown function [Pseudomonas inefficax]